MNFIQWVKCTFSYRHNYFFLEKLSDSSKKIGCHYCKRVFAMNDDVKVILPWDSEFEKFYIETKELRQKIGMSE